MAPSLHYKHITKEAFLDVLSRYPVIAPPKLRELDILRYETIPATVAQRAADDRKAHLTKDEVEKLMEWKLRHGTFRAGLMNLVRSNPAHVFPSTTTVAFAEYPDINPLPALRTLVSLRGIGPATASLILSVYSPGHVPFFSDEVFRWLAWDEPESRKGWATQKGLGANRWARKMKYSISEYEAVVQKGQEVRARLNVSAVDVEKVAWVLGQEGGDCGADAGDGEQEVVRDVGVDRREEAREESKSVKAPRRGTKRRAGDVEGSAEELRRSSRRKVLA